MKQDTEVLRFIQEEMPFYPSLMIVYVQGKPSLAKYGVDGTRMGDSVPVSDMSLAEITQQLEVMGVARVAGSRPAPTD